ncbi:MAG TPA: DEAD/DEAH box helicase family protein, partial [Chitinophagaceae bacterium]|nr:DEAD/DEAH box helicase family protein [Chitinophagaceae bacterium]
MEKSLHQQLSEVASREDNKDFFIQQVPQFMAQNLKATLGKRPYQQEAFGRTIYYLNSYYKNNNEPLQLLFHMATGSGKTVVMAGLILYLYQRGYRHFLFFVNSTTIIEKTKDNFLNKASSKYLFTENVHIGGKEIKIIEGTNFEGG